MRALSTHDRRSEFQHQAEQLAEQTIQAGADGVELLLLGGGQRKVKVRNGMILHVEQSASKSIGLRVFQDYRSAAMYSQAFAPDTLRDFVEDSLAMCRLGPRHAHNEIPSRTELQHGPLPDLDLWDDSNLAMSTQDATEQARQAEAAALACSTELVPGEGAAHELAVWTLAYVCADRRGLAFSGASRSTSQVLRVEVLCQDAGAPPMSGFYWTGGRHKAGLQSPLIVGREAARRAMAKRGSGSMTSGELPVVFAPEATKDLVRLLTEVLSGGAVCRRASYLCEREGTRVASPLCTFIDDPLIPRAFGSRPFDGEGLPSRVNVLIEGGVLRNYLLDTGTARKLGRRSNGCAARDGTGRPRAAVSNFVMQAGCSSVAHLFDGVDRGLFVSELTGYGFNSTTGAFERGASGFLIDRGQLGAPVSQIRISGHFDEILQRIDAIGSDLDCRFSIRCPSIRIALMRVTGW